MRHVLVGRRIVEHLRRPLFQRIITLVVSTLLAMSLLVSISVLVQTSLEHERTLSIVGPFALSPSASTLDVVRIQAFGVRAWGRAPEHEQPAQGESRERRQV